VCMAIQIRPWEGEGGKAERITRKISSVMAKRQKLMTGDQKAKKLREKHPVPQRTLETKRRKKEPWGLTCRRPLRSWSGAKKKRSIRLGWDWHGVKKGVQQTRSVGGHLGDYN